MIARKNNELLENIWLPNGLEVVMVRLSPRFYRNHIQSMNQVNQRQDERLPGGRIPPFFEAICH